MASGVEGGSASTASTVLALADCNLRALLNDCRIVLLACWP